LHARRIKQPFPMFVMPARSADVNHSGGYKLQVAGYRFQVGKLQVTGYRLQVKRPTFQGQYQRTGVKKTIFNFQFLTCNLKPATFNLQSITWNM
jgi:hypothetical protein